MRPTTTHVFGHPQQHIANTLTRDATVTIATESTYFPHPTTTSLNVAFITRCIGHITEALTGWVMLPVTRNSLWLAAAGLSYENTLR